MGDPRGADWSNRPISLSAVARLCSSLCCLRDVCRTIFRCDQFAIISNFVVRLIRLKLCDAISRSKTGRLSAIMSPAHVCGNWTESEEANSLLSWGCGCRSAWSERRGIFSVSGSTSPLR